MSAQFGSLERVRERALAKSMGRSPLYRWMRDNYDGFVALLAEMGRADWSSLTDAIAEDGILDGSGNRPTPTTVRQTWYKVKADRTRSTKSEV